LSDTPGTLKGTWFCGQRKQKKCFLAANQPDGFGAKRDKKHPMPKVKYNAGSLLLWAFFFFLLEVLDILFRYMASLILSNIKKSKPDSLC